MQLWHPLNWREIADKLVVIDSLEVVFLLRRPTIEGLSGITEDLAVDVLFRAALLTHFRIYYKSLPKEQKGKNVLEFDFSRR